MRCFANKKRGVTILELMITILILIVGILAAYAVTNRIIAYTNFSISKLTASYLAQEGIEIVRNIRDTNWLVGDSWDTNIGTGDKEGDYTDLSLESYSGRRLNINGEGFLCYEGADGTTNFKRKINVTAIGSTTMKVVATVQWQQLGKTYEVSVQENLYEWGSGLNQQ